MTSVYRGRGHGSCTVLGLSTAHRCEKPVRENKNLNRGNDRQLVVFVARCDEPIHVPHQAQIVDLHRLNLRKAHQHDFVYWK